MKAIPEVLKNRQNTDVLNHLQGLSCHGDIIIPLSNSLAAFPDVKSYCPDGKNFSFICWYVGDVVFAFASGMQQISLRIVDQDLVSGYSLTPIIQLRNSKNWYAVQYDFEHLDVLVISAYNMARN